MTQENAKLPESQPLKLENRMLNKPAKLDQELYNEMCSVVQAEGYTKLTGYHDDLHVIDRNIIERTWHPRASYLWVVRGMGTHLAPIGLRDKDYIELSAALRLEPTADIFHIDTQTGVQKIDRAKFDEIINKASTYSYSPNWDDPVFYKRKEVLASVVGIDVQTIEPGNQRIAKLTLESDCIEFSDLIAVDHLANHRVTNSAGHKIHTVNGFAIEPLLAKMKACVIENLKDGFQYSAVYIEGQHLIDGSDDGQSNPARDRDAMRP